MITDKGGCFVASGTAYCGNDLVETGEQCDCGGKSMSESVGCCNADVMPMLDSATCADTCCNAYVTSSSNNCKVKSGYQCR